VIRQYDPAYPVDAIATKRPRAPTSFGSAVDMGRVVLNLLRRANAPMTIPGLAERIVALRGLDAQSGAVCRRRWIAAELERALVPLDRDRPDRGQGGYRSRL
jgi:hypothetical protein